MQTIPRFLIDLNVGRLAKWLRAMGYDSLFLPDADDGELLRVAGAQDRVLITKDRYIMERSVVTSGRVKVFLVRTDDFREQLRRLTEEFGLDTSNGFSRCMECNAGFKPIARESVRDRVPEFVFRTQDQFLVCPGCNKVYWRGTHWRNMREELSRIGDLS